MTRRLNLYPKSQKARLVAIVTKLCGKLDRPVCSKDLRSYFKHYPDEQPLLWQRLGQQMFKAARPVPVGCPRIWKIATTNGNAYFAPDEDAHWREKLDLFRLNCRIQHEVRQNVLTHALSLLSTEHRNFAIRAIWHFHRTWIPILDTPALSDFPPAIRLKLQVREAEDIGKTCPTDEMDPEELVDVAAAMAHLRNLAIEWLGEDHACRINFYRYLSRCRADFVSGGRVQRYSLSRLSLLASSLWNPSEDKARVATSLFACSKYARAQARLAEIRSSLSVF